MRLLPLNALRAFEAAARHESFSRAGDELHVTHAAISHQIRNLEDWFGGLLFQRQARGVRLTKAGQTLFAGASSLFVDLASLCKMVETATRRPSLVVGCIPSIASRWLVPKLADFSARHPAIDIKVLYAQASDDFATAGLDVLIGLTKAESEEAFSTRLFSRASRPVCAPRFLENNGPLDSPSQIAAAALLHDESRTAWSQWCKRAGQKRAAPLAGPVFQDFNLLATAVIAGHGVALCPIEVFREEIARGDLMVLSDIEINADKGYYITHGAAPGPTVKHFVAWFIAALND